MRYQNENAYVLAAPTRCNRLCKVHGIRDAQTDPNFRSLPRQPTFHHAASTNHLCGHKRQKTPPRGLNETLTRLAFIDVGVFGSKTALLLLARPLDLQPAEAVALISAQRRVPLRGAVSVTLNQATDNSPHVRGFQVPGFLERQALQHDDGTAAWARSPLFGRKL